ncbi:hypothetical protein [Ruania alba]|uniref:Uncharacterized protein n=1 Tax=Ruania alba TaxID=648782 RepID=A0A1H5BIC2_9MICO|nr:hypothetical protein [Ruania alba]SED54363.1 hypothetical protein SAMN04488554_0116 [Ruania alba]
MTEFDPRYPDGRPPEPARWAAGRIVALVISGVAAVPFLLVGQTVVSSYLSTDPMTDPHGYSRIVGTVALLVLGFVLVCSLPFALPQRLRAGAFSIAGVALLVMVAALLIALSNG